MDKKKIIVIVCIVLLLIIGIILITNKEADTEIQEGEGITTNPVATKKKTDKYEMYNTDIQSQSGTTKIKATIKNITEGKTAEEKLTIVLLDNNKNEIARLPATVPALEKEQATQIVVESLTEYDNIYDFEISNN